MVMQMTTRQRLAALTAAAALAAALTSCHLIPGLDTFDEPARPTPPPQPAAPTIPAEPTLPAPGGTPPSVPMTPEIPPPIDAPAGAAPGDRPLVAGPIAIPDVERGVAAARP